jgi:hypothetical protein
MGDQRPHRTYPDGSYEDTGQSGGRPDGQRAARPGS